MILRYGHTIASPTAYPTASKVRLFHAAVDLAKRLHGINRALRRDRLWGPHFFELNPKPIHLTPYGGLEQSASDAGGSHKAGSWLGLPACSNFQLPRLNAFLETPKLQRSSRSTVTRRLVASFQGLHFYPVLAFGEGACSRYSRCWSMSCGR